MALRPCLGWREQQCTRLTNAPSSRCTEHQRLYEQGRRPVASARARGYDARHQAVRALLLPLAYGKPCPRCGEPMLRGQDLDLGHPIGRPRAADPSSRADHIEHARCNRRAGDDSRLCM